MALKLHVVVHGSGPAFIHRPGSPGVRDHDPTFGGESDPRASADLLAWARQANTSASLVIEDNGVAVDHTLIDCGMGVVTNLTTLDTPAANQPVSRVLFTHGHLDHIAELEVLLMGLQAGLTAGDFSAAEQPWPLPIYATRQTWRQCIGPDPDNAAGGGMFRRRAEMMDVVDVTEAALALGELELHPALTVTPIPAEHYLDSVHYLFTFWPSGQQGEGDPVRVALCWDLLAYPSGRETDVWQGIYLDPKAGWLAEQMHELDLLIMEMTSWRGGARGHIGFNGGYFGDNQLPTGYGVRDLVEWWQPQTMRIVHYDGWNDRLLPGGQWLGGNTLRLNTDPARGPVSDRDLRAALQASFGGTIDIDVAQPGDTISSL